VDNICRQWSPHHPCKRPFFFNRFKCPGPAFQDSLRKYCSESVLQAAKFEVTSVTCRKNLICFPPFFIYFCRKCCWVFLVLVKIKVFFLKFFSEESKLKVFLSLEVSFLMSSCLKTVFNMSDKEVFLTLGRNVVICFILVSESHVVTNCDFWVLTVTFNYAFTSVSSVSDPDPYVFGWANPDWESGSAFKRAKFSPQNEKLRSVILKSLNGLCGGLRRNIWLFFLFGNKSLSGSGYRSRFSKSLNRDPYSAKNLNRIHWNNVIKFILGGDRGPVNFKAVLLIQIRIHMLLGLLDPTNTKQNK
jgi:hypothetical protein